VKRCLLLAALAAVVTFAWRRHRRWVHEFDAQGSS
jgi:hypothetical protein